MSVSATNNDDIMAIALGGQAFGDRMAQFAVAKQQFDDAYAALQIGRDARVEYDKAIAMRADAEKALSDAKAQAEQILNQANEQRAAMVDEASQRVSMVISQANDVKADAERMHADAATVRQQAERDMNEASADIASRIQAVVERESAVVARESFVEKAAAEHGAAKQRYEDLIAKVRSVIAEG